MILAGGKSTRMGQDKAELQLENESLVQIAFKRLSVIFDNVFIVRNTPLQIPELNMIVIPDIYPGMGPASGIHSALTHCTDKMCFILSCDMPFFSTNSIKFICEQSRGYDVTVPIHNGRIYPASALYNKNALYAFEKAISLSNDLKQEKRKSLSLKNILNDLNVQYLDIAKSPAGFNELELFNINTPDDYDYAVMNMKVLTEK